MYGDDLITLYRSPGWLVASSFITAVVLLCFGVLMLLIGPVDLFDVLFTLVTCSWLGCSFVSLLVLCSLLYSGQASRWFSIAFCGSGCSGLVLFFCSAAILLVPDELRPAIRAYPEVLIGILGLGLLAGAFSGLWFAIRTAEFGRRARPAAVRGVLIGSAVAGVISAAAFLRSSPAPDDRSSALVLMVMTAVVSGSALPVQRSVEFPSRLAFDIVV